MKKPTDISHLIPTGYRDQVRGLWITPKALQLVDRLVSEHDMGDREELLATIADSTCSFLTSDYFRFNGWFPTIDRHPFKALILFDEDGKEGPTVILGVDHKARLLMAESELDLPENYADRRVWEEAKTEYAELTKDC